MAGAICGGLALSMAPMAPPTRLICYWQRNAGHMIGKAMAHHAYTCTHRTKWFEPAWGLSGATLDHLGPEERKDWRSGVANSSR